MIPKMLIRSIRKLESGARGTLIAASLLAFGGTLLSARPAAAGEGVLTWQTTSFFGVENCQDFMGDYVTYNACISLKGWMPQALPNDGASHFFVNGVPRPTRVRAGAYAYTPALFGYAIFQYGQNSFDAPFSTRLLKVGSNQFRFDYGQWLKESGSTWDTMTLTFGGQMTELFKIQHAKDQAWELESLNLVTAGHYCTTLPAPYSNLCSVYGNSASTGRQLDINNLVASRSYTLNEVNPGFAQALAALKAAIDQAWSSSIENARTVENLAQRLSELDGLEQELDALLQKQLDQVTPEEVDALLLRYPSVPANVREALVNVVRDFKKGIEELRADLAAITADFGQQVNSVVNLVNQNLGSDGFNPNDPNSYLVAGNFDGIPDVAVPTTSSNPGGFDPAHDQYAAYADKVIDKITAHISGGRVSNRAAFIALVRAWSGNQAALEKALLQNHASTVEFGAFLTARNRVADALRKYLDDQGWFLDNPLPIHIKSLVDGTYVGILGDPGILLKDTLNTWNDSVLRPDARLIGDTVFGIGRGLEFIADELRQGTEMGEAAGALVRSMAFAASRIGIGFVPVAGDYVDACEAITGREWCNPNGRELTQQEQVFSAAGVIIGNRKLWHGVGNAVGGRTGEVAEEVAKLETVIVHQIRIKRIRRWRTLHAAATASFDNPFERDVALDMVNRGLTHFGVGDKAVKSMLGKRVESLGADLKPVDFFSLNSSDNLVLTEVKASEQGEAEALDAIRKFTHCATRLKELGLNRDIAVLELVIPKGGAIGGIYFAKNGMLWKSSQGVTELVREPATNLVIHVLEVVAQH